ncbi:MAG TPA: porin [Sphingomicrobium sp.]|nr:porin [Sphingomicrobium sp.]
MLRIRASKLAGAVAVIAAAGLMLPPAFAAGQGSAKKRPPAVAVSFDPISSFTPANGDPRLAAAFANKRLALTDFKFTPAAAKGRPSQLRVAIRARAATPANARLDATAASATSPVTALTPTSYNLGVAVGWRRFAVSGDVSKTRDADPALGGRETAVVGVSYSLKRFTGRVAVGADRGDGKALPALRRSDNYSVDVGGSYSLSRRIALTGGVRYQVDRDRLSALKDERRDSQAVYVGTAFKF